MFAAHSGRDPSCLAQYYGIPWLPHDAHARAVIPLHGIVPKNQGPLGIAILDPSALVRLAKPLRKMRENTARPARPYEFFPRAEIGRSPLIVVRCISRLAPS